MKKIAVYTCIINNYDRLNEIKKVEEGIDYICFSDNEFSNNTWRIIKVKNDLNLDNSRFSKHPKILPHLYLKDYDISIWIDGNIEVQGNIHELLNSLNDTCFHICRHPSRNCLYKEATIVIAYRVASPQLVADQIAKYKNQRFPENNGLIAGGVIIRNHNDLVCKSIDEQWWQEILNFSKRDQLSFNYVAWKNPSFKFEYIKEDFRSFIMNGKYFKYLQHLPKK
jgi:hypothetical protein